MRRTEKVVENKKTSHELLVRWARIRQNGILKEILSLTAGAEAALQ
jgi:hypothetical protein